MEPLVHTAFNVGFHKKACSYFLLRCGGLGQGGGKRGYKFLKSPRKRGKLV